MRFIHSRVHGVLDYVVGTLLIFAPRIFGFQNGDPEDRIPVILGAPPSVPRRARLSSEEPDLSHRLREILRRAFVVFEIRFLFSSHGHPKLTEKIVGPCRIEMGAGPIRSFENFPGIPIVLGNQKRTALMRHVGNLGGKIPLRVIVYHMSRIQAQPVDTEIIPPVREVTQKEIPNRLRLRSSRLKPCPHGVSRSKWK